MSGFEALTFASQQDDAGEKRCPAAANLPKSRAILNGVAQ